MIYSKTCEYAIRALSYLASKKEKQLTMIPEIGQQTKVPVAYIAKIFQSLVKNDILVSRRGPSGGYALKKVPEELSLLEIVGAVDDINLMNECLMGFEDCSHQNACPLHETWTQAKEKLLNRLKECSLRELIEDAGERTYRPCRRNRLQLSFCGQD